MLQGRQFCKQFCNIILSPEIYSAKSISVYFTSLLSGQGDGGLIINKDMVVVCLGAAILRIMA